MQDKRKYRKISFINGLKKQEQKEINAVKGKSLFMSIKNG